MSQERKEITVADVLLVLGQKELELYYERLRSAQASQVIADLQAELAKREKE